MALTFRLCLSTQYDKNVSMSSWDWNLNKKSSFASGNSLLRAFLSAFFLSSLFICRKAGSVTSPRNKSLWLCAQFQAVWRSLTMVGCCTWIYKYINGTNKLNYLSSLHATPWYMTTRIIYLISVLFNHNSSAGWLFGGGGFWHPKDRLKGSLKELGCFFCPVCKSLSVPLSNM